MTCPECHTELMASARFCHMCGRESKSLPAIARRPAWKRWSISVILGFSALLLLWLLLIPRGGAVTTLVPGQVAPDFELQSLKGTPVRLADLKGKPVILNFWATWCRPCQKEMPDFQAVYEKYREQGLQVIGINVGESQVGVAGFVRQVGVRFPILLDLTESAQSAYKILPLPTTFFIDRQGIIRALYQYQMSRTQIESEVQRLLGR